MLPENVAEEKEEKLACELPSDEQNAAGRSRGLSTEHVSFLTNSGLIQQPVEVEKLASAEREEEEEGEKNRRESSSSDSDSSEGIQFPIGFTRHPQKMYIRNTKSVRETEGNTCCNMRVFTDYVCCRYFRKQVRPIEIIVPIASIDDTLSGPFAFDMIDSDIMDFLIQKAWDELLFKQDVHIIFQTLERKDMCRRRELQVAVQNSFRYFGTMTHYESLRAGSEGWWSALLAVFLYGIFLVCAIYLLNYYKETNLVWADIFYQLIVIIMWVVAWHPIEILIFSRMMLRRKKMVCARLEEAEISLQLLELESLLAIKGGIAGGIEVLEDDEEDEANNLV